MTHEETHRKRLDIRRKLAESVADLLPGEWTYSDTFSADGNVIGCHIQRADGLTLAFYGGPWNKPTMCEIRHDRDGGAKWDSERNKVVRSLYFRNPSPSINVTATRPPAAVAKEITRRLLADAEADAADVAERLQSHLDYVSATDSNLQKFADAIGLPVRTIQHNGEQQVHFYRHNGQRLVLTATSTRDSVRIDLDCVPDLAARVGAVLKGEVT